MRLVFAGDVMLGRLVNQDLKGKPPEAPWGDTMPLFREADARFCNLECVISDRGEPWSETPKVFHFRTDSKNVVCLKAAGVDAVSLANNHTLDYGYEAMSDMLSILDRDGIRHAGAGKDIKEARRPAILDVKGTKVAFISFTDNEPGWEASLDRPGTFYSPVEIDDPRAQALFGIVKQARETADFVIVAAHWGPNWGYRPQPSHPPFAHALVDSGADIVFGHSCHVFQGVEFYKGRPVIYSAGNFVDDYAVDEVERNDESFVFAVETEGRAVKRMLMYPTMIIRFQARRARGYLAEEIAFKMKRLSKEFGTKARWLDDEEALEVMAAH